MAKLVRHQSPKLAIQGSTPCGFAKREDIMKVKFRDNYLIYRTSVEEMIKVIVEIAQRDGDQEEAIKILKNRGWTIEDIEKFDEMWSKAAENVDPFEIQFVEEVCQIAKNNMDLTQFWCMK